MNTEALSQITQEFATKLRGFSWKSISYAVAGSFVLAVVTTTAAEYLLMRVLNKSILSQSRTTGIDAPDQEVFQKTFSVSADTIKIIMDRNLFNSENEVADESANQDPRTQAVKTLLPIKFVGVIYGGDPFNSIAVVENKSKNAVNSFVAGDPLIDRATLKEVHADRILIENEGRLEYALLEEQEIRRSNRKKGRERKSEGSGSLAGGDGISAGKVSDTYKEEGFERKGGDIQITQTYKSRLLGADFANVLQDAKAIPNMTPEGIKGFKFEKIRENSVYEKAGMVNGDIVDEVNGVPLTDAAQAIKLLQSLRNENEIEIMVNRGGSKQRLTIKVR